jgi:hypothetical protein
MVFPDGKRVSMMCEIYVVREFQDGFPFKSDIVGRVWGFTPPYKG